MKRGGSFPLAVALFVCGGFAAYAATFEDAELSWSGNRVHVEVKTDLPDGESRMMSVSARTKADIGVRAQFIGRVKKGRLIGDGTVELVKDTINDHINLEPGHSLLAIYGENGNLSELKTFSFAH